LRSILSAFIFLIGTSPLTFADTPDVLAHAPACELVIYTYDSIAGKGGLGPKIFPAFEQSTGCKVRVLASGDAVQTLGRVEIDSKRGHGVGDLILGVDPLLWDRVFPLVNSANFLSKNSDLSSQLVPAVREVATDYAGLVPYDFGSLALMADSAALSKASLQIPHSLRDLNQPEWKKNIILEDPRTSSPGLEFVLFTKKVLGADFSDFWKKLRSQWLAMPPGWDDAYGLFLKGQAPLVWSYMTSQAYHQMHASGTEGGPARYRAVTFSEGQPLQVEGAVLLKNAPHTQLAEKFLNYLLSDSVQSQIATTNWMWPARDGVSVPDAFRNLPKPLATFVLSGKDRTKIIKEWSEAIHE
jgi:thiamine transport system substrate-binding protein